MKQEAHGIIGMGLMSSCRQVPARVAFQLAVHHPIQGMYAITEFMVDDGVLYHEFLATAARCDLILRLTITSLLNKSILELGILSTCELKEQAQ